MVLKSLNKQTAPKSVAPERIIQFGEGNFLRAFVVNFIDEIHPAKVTKKSETGKVCPCFT